MEDEGRYRVRFEISREDARKFLAELATNDDLRATIESSRENAAEELEKRQIFIDPELLPTTVKLPDKKEIAHLLYAGDSAWGETASPFGWLIVFVFGAMPVTTRRSLTGDSAG